VHDGHLRRPLYEEVATVIVRTDGLTPDEVTAEVLTHLRADLGKDGPQNGRNNPDFS